MGWTLTYDWWTQNKPKKLGKTGMGTALREYAAAERAFLDGLADAVLDHANPAAVLQAVDEVWTMTSLIGFEALIRGVRVTTTGAPFYAGWGLTQDRGATPDRRRARPTLTGLVHAALIDYPRYIDPVTRLPCAVETAVARLASGQTSRPPLLRLLAKAQGLLASRAPFWR